MFKKNGLLKSPDSKPKEKYLLLFAVAFIGMMISFIPSMIVLIEHHLLRVEVAIVEKDALVHYHRRNERDHHADKSHRKQQQILFFWLAVRAF